MRLGVVLHAIGLYQAAVSLEKVPCTFLTRRFVLFLTLEAMFPMEAESGDALSTLL